MEFLYNENMVKESTNITDRWILSFMQSLVGFFETEMAGMSLFGLPPRNKDSLFIITLLISNFFSL